MKKVFAKVMILLIGFSNGIIYGQCSTSYSLPVGTEPYSITFSPDGSLLATANNENSVSLFSVTGSTLNLESAFPAGTNFGVSVRSIVFSPDGSLLAVSSYWSDKVALYGVSGNTLSGPDIYPLPNPGGDQPVSIAFSPIGNILATANSDSKDVTLFGVVGGNLTSLGNFPIPVGASGDPGVPRSIAFSPDGTFFAVTGDAEESCGFGCTDYSQKDYIATYNSTDLSTDTFDLPQPLNKLRGLGSMAFSADGSFLAVLTGFSDVPLESPNQAIVIFLVNGDQLTDPATIYVSRDDAGGDIAISPDGSLFALPNDRGQYVSPHTITLIPLGMDPFSASLPDGGERPNSIAFSPDGTLLVTANEGSDDVSLFDVDCVLNGGGESGDGDGDGSTAAHLPMMFSPLI